MEIYKPDREIIFNGRRIRYSSKISRSENSFLYLESYLSQKKLSISDLSFEIYLLSENSSLLECSGTFITSTSIEIKDNKDYFEPDFVSKETTHFKVVDVYQNGKLLGESRMPYKIEDYSNARSNFLTVEEADIYGMPSKVSQASSKGLLDFSVGDCDIKEGNKFQIGLVRSKRIVWKTKMLMSLYSKTRMKIEDFYFRTVYECPEGQEFEQFKKGDQEYEIEREKAKKILGLT